jgi:hypothetical protein
VEKHQQVPVWAWFFTGVAGNNLTEVNSSLKLSTGGCAATTNEAITATMKNSFRIMNI